MAELKRSLKALERVAYNYNINDFEKNRESNGGIPWLILSVLKTATRTSL